MGRLSELIRHELESALRTRRVLVLVVLYLACALIGGAIVNHQIAEAETRIIAELSERADIDPEVLRAQYAERADEMIDTALEEFGMEPATIAPALRTSMSAGIFFFFSLLFLPFLIVFSTFDRLSTSLRDRVLCYDSLGASRASIVTSKFIAQVVIIGAITALCSVSVFTSAWLLTDSMGAVQAVTTGGWCAAVLLPYVAAYVGLSLFCSSRSIQPIAALVMSFGLMFLLRLAGLPFRLLESGAMSDTFPMSLLGFLRFISPHFYEHGLWRELGGSLLFSAGGYSAIAALFLGLTILSVQRRDL